MPLRHPSVPSSRPNPAMSLVLTLAALGLGLGPAACTTSPPVSDGQTTAVANPADRPGSPSVTAYETFDMVWSTVDERHFDPDHHGVDWDAIRREYRPRVEDTRSEDEVRRLLMAMLDELGQTHFVIIPKEAADAANAEAASMNGDPAAATAASEDAEPMGGSTGMTLDWQDDAAIVVAVRPESPAAAAGVRPGWRLDRMDDFEPTTDLAGVRSAAAESGAPFAVTRSMMMLNARATGEVGDAGTFTFIDGDDRTIDRTLVFEPEPGERVGFGLLPPTPVRFESRLLSNDELVDWGVQPKADGSMPTIAVAAFNIWMFPILQPLARAVDEHRDVDGFVLDLRGNPGGVGGLAMGAAGHFMAEEASLGDLVSRDTTMHFAVNPQRVTPDGRLVAPFAGPVAILMDTGSASTSEVFAAGMQQLGRATVVGRPSAGAALPAHLTTLPNGDTFMFAIADFIGPAGNSIEGTGVIPDLPVAVDRDRLLAESDSDLATAARWIADELTAD